MRRGYSRFTGVGLGLLIGVTLSMAGIYRGMADDAKVLLDNSSVDLWVVQKETLGPYAESSSIYQDTWRGIRGMPGVARAANVTYLTMQVRQGRRDLRALRRDRIGFVFQAPYLNQFLDVTDNVALLPMLAGVANGQARKRALELLTALDVQHRASAMPTQLSGVCYLCD